MRPSPTPNPPGRTRPWIIPTLIAVLAIATLPAPGRSDVKRPRAKRIRAILARARRDKEALLKDFRRRVRKIARQSKDEAQFQKLTFGLLLESEDALGNIKDRAVNRLAAIAVEPQFPSLVIGAAGGDVSRALCALVICCKSAVAEMNERAKRLELATIGGDHPLVAFVILPRPPIIQLPLPPKLKPTKPIRITGSIAARLSAKPNSGVIYVEGRAEPGTLIDVSLTCGGVTVQTQVTADRNCRWVAKFTNLSGPANCTAIATEVGNPNNNDHRSVGSC